MARKASKTLETREVTHQRKSRCFKCALYDLTIRQFDCGCTLFLCGSCDFFLDLPWHTVDVATSWGKRGSVGGVVLANLG